MRRIQDEFKSFVNEDKSKKLPDLDSKLYQIVEREVDPSRFMIFTKVLGIHALVATLSLLFCPQFGLKAFRHQPDITEALNVFGEYGCHLACGFIFMGGSLLAASLLLSKDEVRKIRMRRILILGPLTLLSLGFFTLTSPSIIYQGIGLIWAIGAILSGALFLELGWKLRAQSQMAG